MNKATAGLGSRGIVAAYRISEFVGTWKSAGHFSAPIGGEEINARGSSWESGKGGNIPCAAL